ncbi:PspC domain-containing protein [Candidatus Nomurabacteria bacterium]|nr:PspC domain-containing protein [Candidatus Nomurabacteria bacterium]
MTKRLYKSNTNKVISGVIGGVGEYFDIDPTLLRLAYILIAIVTAVFPAMVGYFIACLVVPNKPIEILNK